MKSIIRPWKRIILCSFILASLLSPALAQTNEDLQKMGKDGEGFQFHLKFRGSSAGTLDPASAKYAKIAGLLEKWNNNVPAEIQSPFKVQGEAAGQKPNLSAGQQATLKDLSTRFFRDMAAEGLTMWDLQQFKEQFKGKNPRIGDNPVDPKIAWKDAYMSIERTLMGGRTMMIMDVWKQTMLDFFRAHPEAVGVVYGQMDIGSWVKMNVDGLGFAADIDFSTIATDLKTNKAIHDLFAENLQRASGLNMIAIDVVHTAHGLAGAEVFIGEWGKAFAEVDMLRRGKWKMLELVKNENGAITDIRTTEKEGKNLFMEMAGNIEYLNAKKDPNNFDPKEKYPQLTMDMEPMLSLEMLRHAMHDIEHGPFSGGQKIIKMIKYTERSFFMLDEAGKTIPYKDAYDYFNLTDDEKKFKTLCEDVIKNKSDAGKIVTLLETFTGQKLESAAQVDLIVQDIMTRSKKAMLKNAKQAFGYRIKQIANITDEGQRWDAADKMLKQLNEEFEKGFGAGGTEIPKTMLRAHTLLVDLRAGKISAADYDIKMKELEKLLEEEYKIDRSFIERWVGDTWMGVKKFFADRGFKTPDVEKLVERFKQRFIETLKDNTSDATQKNAKSAYEYASKLNTKLNEFHEHMMKTKSGRVMSLDLVNYVDNAFAIYDAWMSGKDNITAARNVAITSATLYLQGRWPFLAVPLGFYNSYKEGSVAPAAMAVTFYMFPYLGQMYMVASLFDRIVVSNVKDNTFKANLENMAGMAVTDGKGHVIRFKVPRAFSGLTGSPDSLETDPDIPLEGQGRIDAVKNIFYNPEFLYCPNIKYFNGLIPSSADRLGPWDLYEKKIDNLIGFFSFDNSFMGYLYNLKLFIKKQDSLKKGMDADAYFNQRQSMIDSLHNTIEDRLWLSIFNAIETSKSGEQDGVLKEYAAALDRLADSCDLEYYNTKQIDSPSLQQRVDKEIKSDPMYSQSIGGQIKNIIGGNKDQYSSDKSIARIAAVVYEKYISTYRTIIKVQEKVNSIIYDAKGDNGVLQTKPTVRYILMGGKDAAPMLTGIPERDIDLAQKTLEAYNKRAGEIRIDLVNALGRPYNEKTDLEHMKVLAQLAFEFQHFSEDINSVAYGGSFDALTAASGHVNKDLPLEMLTQMKDRKQRYLDYLAKLKEVPALVLRLQIKAESKTTETVPVTAEAIITDENDKPLVNIPPDVAITWYRADTQDEVKVGEGKTLTDNAEKQGYNSYKAVLTRKTKDKTIELYKNYWNLQINAFNINDPSKGVKLKLPAVVKQYEIFDVSAEIPAAVMSKGATCRWDGDMLDKKDCSGAKLQFIAEQSRKDKEGKPYLDDSIAIYLNIEIPVPGRTYGNSTSVFRKVKFQHMAINIKVTDIWEGGSGTTWFNLQRKAMKSPPRVAPWSDDKKPRSYGEAYALLSMKSDRPFATKINTLEELKAYIEKENEYNLKGNKSLEVKAISIGDFKGYGVFSPATCAPGGWSDAGYRGAGASTGLSGMVMKGGAFFKVNWYANASGAFDNVDNEWMMSTVKMLAAECQSILASAAFTPDGRVTRSPYTGPKLDGSDYPSVTIEPKVDTVQPGSKISVKAVIKNDKPEYGPYTYTWTGNADANATGAAATLNTARPGKQSISVSVGGTTPPGGASLDYVVAPLKLKLTKVSPATDKIVVGMPVSVKADFISPVPAGRKLQYLWQPHPEEKFDPFEGSSNSTKVIFSKPGKKKIWVQVLDKTTAETITMGESSQLELEVINPTFNITFTPAKAMVGQQVTAKINSAVKLDDADYRWMPLSESGSLVKESQDGTEIVFYAKNTSSIEVRALARVKGSGEDLGEAKNNFMADLYNIKIEGPKVQGPKPMIWKPGVGLVEVDKEIAVDQVVEFATVVTPMPSATLTYDWKIEQGSATISNPASRDARITASATGQVQAKVTVKDNNGIVLGTALASFNATISNEMISNGKAQQKDFDDKMTKARQAIKDGKLDDAIKLADELKAIDPKKAAPLMTELATACNKAGKDAAYERDFELAIKRYQKAIELMPGDANAKKQLEQCKKWAKEWPNVLAKGKELENIIQQKNLPAAFDMRKKINDLQFNMPGQMGNKWSLQLSAKVDVFTKQCDSAYTRTQSMWTEDFKKNDFEDGLNVLETFKAEWTVMEGSMKNINSSIQLCKSQIAEQKRIYSEFQEEKATFEKGLPIDPKHTPFYFNMQAGHFATYDKRGQEILLFADGMNQRQKEITAYKTKADQLKKEGAQAEASGQLDIAVGKYKESVALVPDAILEAKIKKMETDLAVVNEIRNKADELWINGEKLVSKRKTRDEGLQNMKQSLNMWYDKVKVDRIRQLEKEFHETVSSVDVSGVWKHGTSETFTFTSLGDGNYTAIEKGFDNAQGTLTMAGETGVIDYTTKKGTKGRYVISFAADGSTGSGKWTDEKGSGERIFQRISKPATKEPDITKTDKPVTEPTTPTKKKKGFLGILGDIGKGLDKVDSVLTGKKPADKTTQPTTPTDNTNKQPTTTTKQPGTAKDPGNTSTVGEDKGVPAADATVEEQIWYNGNIGGVQSGPTKATVFTLSAATYVTRVENYHYFNRGVKPGIISLKGSNGQTYGPWQCYGVLGQGGVQNATWVAQPKMQLPAGSYTVIDSDPSTWSHNSQSGGAGFTTVWALKKGKAVPVTKKTGTDKGYTIEDVETGGGVEAQRIFITGDIDNLGFGFAKGFDVFSGNSTPSHGYPWKVDPNDPAGTDRIMVGTGATGSNDGYSSNTSRPDNKPQAITLNCNMNGITPHAAVLQMFVDDFQAAAFGSQFTVTINGRRAGFVETVLNSLNQTGPIGKLISMKLPPEFMNEIAKGQLVIYVDDATTGKGDGFAIDFVRLIMDPTSYTYTGTITGIIRRPDGQPAAGAPVSAGGIISTTANAKGEFTLKNVPAGMVSISTSYNGHHHKTITTDLVSGKTIRVTIDLPPDQ